MHIAHVRLDGAPRKGFRRVGRGLRRLADGFADLADGRVEVIALHHIVHAQPSSLSRF